MGDLGDAVPTPTPNRLRKIRAAAGLTQTEAAAVVYVGLRAWQRWEQDGGDNSRAMPAAAWELFLLKLPAGTPLPADLAKHVAALRRLIARTSTDPRASSL